MNELHNLFNTLQKFDLGNGRQGSFYSLPALEKAGVGAVSKLPVSIRLVLEAVLRNCDGKKVTEKNIRELAQWQANAARTEEIPFIVARIVLQDFTGVPLLVDLAAMRSAVARMGKNPKIIEPLVPVDLVVDHSVQVDFAGSALAMQRNLEIEFQRNRERYQFLKWGMQAFETFKVVPPGIGIVHQVNLEYLAQGVLSSRDHVYYPDTLVGTDSHTTMINGLGIVGWGVGGIEAEAGMLGEPVYFLTPDVVGVHLTGALREGVTATDLALTVTQMLRKAKVVGKFVEFYGPGATALPVVDRATIANMAPECGATMGFFPIDGECVNYLRATGRSEEHCTMYENYYRAQGLFGIPKQGEVNYSTDLELDLATVVPSIAGPKRPQDRIELPKMKSEFTETVFLPAAENGFGKKAEDMALRVTVDTGASAAAIDHSYGDKNGRVSASESEMRDQHPTPDEAQDVPASAFPRVEVRIGHGERVDCGNHKLHEHFESERDARGGFAGEESRRKRIEAEPRGEGIARTGVASGDGLFEQDGATAISGPVGVQPGRLWLHNVHREFGPLAAPIEEAIIKNDLVAASVLSGNRNFEARVHQNIKANFLMSPPLVVAFALAGRVDIDLSSEPIGQGTSGPVYLKDIWPTLKDVRDQMQAALKPEVFRTLYKDFAAQNPKWNEIPSSTGNVYEWDAKSTYIQEPPFFKDFSMKPGEITEIKGARPLGIFGDSVTTDHISPAGSIKKTSPAGKYLIENGVDYADFNSYGSRRGNDRVMTRGTFANVRIKNLMVPGVEGGVTKFNGTGEVISIFDAAVKYAVEKTPLIVLAGQEYGTGSSRDWAAKGTNLLGVKVVVAQSFERIHRSNLVGMGVLPLQFW